MNLSLKLKSILNFSGTLSHKYENIKTLSLLCASPKLAELITKGKFDLYHNFSNSYNQLSKSFLKVSFNNAFTFSIIKIFGNFLGFISYISFKILSICHKSHDLLSLSFENHFCFHC